MVSVNRTNLKYWKVEKKKFSEKYIGFTVRTGRLGGGVLVAQLTYGP